MLKLIREICKPSISIIEIIIVMFGSVLINKLSASSWIQIIMAILFTILLMFLVKFVSSFGNLIYICRFFPKRMQKSLVQGIFFIFTGQQVTLLELEFYKK